MRDKGLNKRSVGTESSYQGIFAKIPQFSLSSANPSQVSRLILSMAFHVDMPTTRTNILYSTVKDRQQILFYDRF